MRRPVAFAFLALAAIANADKVPSPKEFFGHDICEDYWLANYKQLTAYWKELDKRSDRLTMVSIGKTEDGREQYMCIITDPANRRGLEGYRKASERLARAKDFKNDDEARAFAQKQKAVVWIDGGLHASELLVAQQLIEQAYRMVSRDDEENKRILRDTITLLVHANPDGNDWVVDHYMRRSNPQERSAAGLPFLYQKYIGHDNNRDFYSSNMAESKNINRVLYTQWYPQIVYNHHQSAPAGTIMFIPPFRNPFNFHMDALTLISTDLVGTHMHQRLIGEGKGGTAMRNSTLYSTWWNGGLRTTTYFHNMVGILTETWGSPNPARLPFTPRFQVPTTDVPLPIEQQMWHLRYSLEYEISANYAILDYASRYRERLLFNFYRAGRNSIERGSKDNWTRYPSRIAALGAEALSKPELRDARYYVLPIDQADGPTVAEFIKRLQITGVEIERLTADLNVPSGSVDQNGKPVDRTLPSGSYVIRCDQAFRPHVLDMFEPQDHPNDFQYPGGPPIPPYDNAGYTLAFQMGVDFVRILDKADVKSEPIKGEVGADGFIQRSGAGWTKQSNSTYREVNRTLKAGDPVAYTPGPIFINGTSSAVQGAVPLKRRPRVALWDRYGGSMESGWTRWVLEQFEFDYELVFPPDLDWGNLNEKYDCIIFPDGGIPGLPARPQGGATSSGGQAVSVSELGGVRIPTSSTSLHETLDLRPETGTASSPGARGPAEPSFAVQGGGGQQNLANDTTIPYFWRRRIGSITPNTIAKLKEFVANGGHLLCIGSSSLNAARQFGLPIESALVDDKGANLPNTKFYIPGSVLRMKLNPGPLTAGMGEYVDVMFDNSPAFRFPSSIPAARLDSQEVVPGEAVSVGYYDTDKPLRSGWAWGQETLKSTIGIADVPYGKGRFVLYGPEILFRGQSHGAFKLLFNGIFRSAAK